MAWTVVVVGLRTLCGLDMTPRSELGVKAMTNGVVLSEFGPQPVYNIVMSCFVTVYHRFSSMAPAEDA